SGYRLFHAPTVPLPTASGGGGAALGWLGAAGLVVLVGGAAGRRWLREALWAVMLGIGLYAALFLTAGIPPQSALERAGTGSTGRLEMWAAALRMIGHNPWFGVGPMHFAYYPNPHANSPHNIALQIAAEWGLPAALLGLGLLGWGVSRWIGAVRRSASGGGGEPGGWRVGLTGAVVAALLNLQLDGALIMGPSQVVAALMLAALLAEGLRAGEGRATPSGGGGRGRRFAQPVLVGAVLACVLAVGWVTVLDLPTLHRRHYDYRDVRLTPGAQPRYWSFGVIAPQEGMPEGWERYWPAVAREHASAVASAAGEGGAGDGTQER
ncbi:MAG: O-antigen ligase family protein, partial [Rhodothermales bacterium]|nr:O-antigen ligase family protein [Rhodothermales bacterium]